MERQCLILWIVRHSLRINPDKIIMIDIKLRIMKNENDRDGDVICELKLIN